MAPRAFGALLALVAALLFMASLAGAIAPTKVPAWWEGHPTIGTKTFEQKAIHVGLLGASGCNLGETVRCDSLETGALLQPIGIAELAALGILSFTTIALLVSIWRIGERRKGLSRVVVIEVLIAAAIGGAWVALGPDIKAGTATVNVPMGFGVYAFGGGALAALIAGLLGRIVEREPLRLKTSRRMPAPEPLEAFDVREFAQAQRPSQPAIPPTPAYSQLATPVPGPPAPVGTGPHAPLARMPSAPSTGPHAPLGRMPTPPGTGPHAPHAPHVAAPSPPPAPPLFEHAPQLRPLYDMANVGVVPAPPPPRLPERPPTPIPRSSIAETSEFPKSETKKPRPPPVATPPARTKAASLPPMRQVAPPSRGSATPDRPMSKQPTLAHAVPPMPPMTSARAETDPEPSTAVEIDAEAKAKWQAEQARKVATKKPTPAPTPPPAPAPSDTDQNPVTPDRTDPIEIRPTTTYSVETRAALAEMGVASPVPPELAATNVSPAIELGELATRATEMHDAQSGPMAPAATSVPQPGPPGPAATPAVTVDKADFDRTLERNPPPPTRPSAPSLKLQPISVPKTIAPKPIPNVLAPSAPPQRATPVPPSAEPSKPAHVPLSTAPASLPPPKQAQALVSGPTPACPQCEAPMTWVEEHLRFYCKQCRMYF